MNALLHSDMSADAFLAMDRPECEAREAHSSVRGQLDFSSSESRAMRNELNRWTDFDRLAR